MSSDSVSKPKESEDAKRFKAVAVWAMLIGIVLITIVLIYIHWTLATLWVACWCFAFAYSANECRKEAEASALTSK